MERFEQHTPEFLGRQMDTVSKTVGQEIAPPSKKEAVIDMDYQELKEKFPRRYEIYLNTIRKKNKNEDFSKNEKKEISTDLKTLNALDEYIEKHKGSEDNRTLREAQFDVFEKLRDFLETGEKGGYIKLPTGVGKTVLFVEFLEATRLKSLIVVPTNPLVNQTGEKLKEFSDLEYGYINKAAKERGRDVTVITYASLMRQLKNGGINPKDYGCLILDEAHEALGPNTKLAVEQFSHAIRLGFTATPDYSAEKSVSDILGNEIYSMKVQEAIDKGLLCQVQNIVIPISEKDVDLSQVEIIGDDYNKKKLEKVINNGVLNEYATKFWEKNFVSNEIGLAYCAGVEHAENLAKEFSKKGISAKALSGETPEEERQSIFEAFNRGEIRVLCNSDLLIQGFDEKKASVCLNLRPTLSAVKAEQRGGRVMRLDPNNHGKLSLIIDFLYKTKNGKNHPILYQEVLGDEAVKRAQISTGGGGSRGVREPIVGVEGIKILTDPIDVWKLVKEMKENEVVSAEWLTSEEFLSIVSKQFRNKGIEVDFVGDDIMDLFKDSHPECFKVGMSRERKTIMMPSRSQDHYLPELANHIVKDYESSFNWPQSKEIAKKFNLKHEAVKQIEKRLLASDFVNKKIALNSEEYIPGVAASIHLASEFNFISRYARHFTDRVIDELKQNGAIPTNLTPQDIIESTHIGKIATWADIKMFKEYGGASKGMLARRLKKEGLEINEDQIETMYEELRDKNPTWFIKADYGAWYMSREAQEIITTKLKNLSPKIQSK